MHLQPARCHATSDLDCCRCQQTSLTWLSNARLALRRQQVLRLRQSLQQLVMDTLRSTEGCPQHNQNIITVLPRRPKALAIQSCEAAAPAAVLPVDLLAAQLSRAFTR